MSLSIRFLFAIGTLALLPLHAVVPEPSVEEPPVQEPPAEDPPAEEEQETVIVSEHLKMVKRGGKSYFVFSRNVKVTTTDMTIFCDEMEVFAGRQDDAAEGDESELGRLEKIVAMGNVRILNEDREATSGRAEVFPKEGRIELTENPVLRNEQGRISGAKIIFYQGEQEAEVLSDASQLTRVTLPSLPALGANAEKPARENERTID